MKNYIGIDISKSSIDVYDGKKSYKFKNDEDGFRKVVLLSENSTFAPK
jgi:transposase